nr:astra-associated protein 1 [Quercus suber]
MTADNRRLHSSTLPPALPSYIFRGHEAQIHALHFFRQNLRLLSGDAEGWIVLWDLPIRRAVAVWRAHEATVLGLGSWRDDRIITFASPDSPQDERQFSTKLPLDDATTERKKPWLLHNLAVNALNFCSFASILKPSVPAAQQEELILAVPGVEDGAINVTSLPSETRIATIPPPDNTKTGMLMAIALHYPTSASNDTELTVIAGYESGAVAIWCRPASQSNEWQPIYLHQAHTQPVLSVAVDAIHEVWFSSSADATIGKYLLAPSLEDEPVLLKTKHAGQQSVSVRSDGQIFVTAGWDGRGRVYGVEAFEELAVLKWHKQGMYATAFADVNINKVEAIEDEDSTRGTEVMEKRALTVVEQRIAKTQATHWLAAGSKDGRISLWDIY